MSVLAPLPRPKTFRHTIAAAAGSPAHRFFGLMWGGSALYLLFTPYRQTVLIGLGVLLVYGLYVWFAHRFVPPTPPDSEPVTVTRGRLWLQVRVLLLIVIITALKGLAFHQILPDFTIPFWTPLMNGAVSLGQSLGVPVPQLIANPLSYFIIPGAVLVMLGATPRELGLRLGHRSLHLTLIFGFHAIAAIVIGLVMGAVSPVNLLYRFGSNALQNGFMEEFLFRGAIQSRLAILLSPAWGLVISSLGFGIWHLGLNMSLGGGDWLAAIAIGVVLQGTMGLLFGYVFQRSRSLLAPSLVHILGDSMPF